MRTTDGLLPWLLSVAVVAGVTGDLLLHIPVWGIGFSAWALILFAGLLLVARRGGDFPPADALITGGLSVVCALCLSWRDTVSLSSANVLAFFFGAGLLMLRTGSARLSRAPILQFIHGFVLQALHATAGMAILTLKDLPPWWRSHPSGRIRLLPALRGFILALPLLVVFGALLASADAGFQFLVEQILKIDLPEIFSHLFVAGLLCWIVGGILRGRFLAAEVPPPTGRPEYFRIGMTETSIVLGGLDILFAVFVLLQIPYFFGGHQTVLGTPSLTYAEYARRGFFELIGVVGFAIPLLLMIDWLTCREGVAVRVFRLLGGVTVGLLVSIMASAMCRLWLYIERFGLTEARLNAAALLVWFGFVLAWFCVSVLGGRRERFAYGAIVVGYCVLLLLNIGNPGAIVVRTNLARAAAGVTFDARYNATLGADAVPELLAGLAALPEAERDAVSWELLCRFGRGGTGRGWNAGLAGASALVASRQDQLRSYLLPQTAVPFRVRAEGR
jgi:hypothetical protein